MSRLISRQIGLLIDRQGRVDLTIIGTPKGILIPELSRERSTSGRLRGLRLLHTHLNDTPLSHEDLMDLLFLRLDSIGVLTVDEHGSPINFQSAHLVPHHVADIPEAQGWTHSKKKSSKVANEKNQDSIKPDFTNALLNSISDEAITNALNNAHDTNDTHGIDYIDGIDDTHDIDGIDDTNNTITSNTIDSILNDVIGVAPANAPDATDESIPDKINNNTDNLSDSIHNNTDNIIDDEQENNTGKALTSINIKDIINQGLNRQSPPIHQKDKSVDETGTKEASTKEANQEPIHDATKEPYQQSEFMAWDKVQNDFAAEIGALEEEFARLIRTVHPTRNQKFTPKGKSKSLESGARAILVSVSKAPKVVQEASLIELAELAKTAGLVIAGSLVQRVTKIHPRQILSQTKLAELEVIALQGHAAIIIFDGELSPAQLHNLAELTERKLLDRTQLILDIFAQHAKTGAGKLQVEMAQLKYTQPRLAGKNRGMDRLMGGIGGRGPGETKLETDRRRVRERIARIQNELETLKKQRAANRARRAKQELPVATLVGYTNAGKSTLLNRLTKSDVIAENKLFATLDPTTRRLRFPKEKEIVLADTVGFIRELPKDLIEAFRATLEELNEADLLLHVVDASHPEMDQQLDAVESILEDLKLQDIPCLLLLNKWDDVELEERLALSERFPQAFPISALTGFGLDRATKHIEKVLF